MKILKNAITLILAFCLIFCLTGCGGDEYENFEPVGVRVVESIGGTQYETMIDDPEIAKQMWNTFKDLDIDTETEAEMGTAYLYMCLYNEDQSTLAIFTIYENGACCMGEDFTTLYTVVNGEDVYLELCDIYTSYEAE